MLVEQNTCLKPVAVLLLGDTKPVPTVGCCWELGDTKLAPTVGCCWEIPSWPCCWMLLEGGR